MLVHNYKCMMFVIIQSMFINNILNSGFEAKKLKYSTQDKFNSLNKQSHIGTYSAQAIFNSSK